uniref:Fatty-acid and retinol-binding protein 1 n=1 Tax=Schizaphis graminum TaxID=13262 RepID=A0A2S2P1U5_SCHGA
MKTSYFFGFLISALVLQISSAESSEPTELDKMAANLMHSLVDVIEIPYRKLENILNPSAASGKKESFLKEIIVKFNRKKEEIEKAYLESLSPEERELTKKKLIEHANSSQRITNSIRDTSKAAKLMINTYFNNLPRHFQNKIFDLGKDFINILNKIKA